MPITTVDRRGRITLPGELRALLGLRPGSAVRVEVEKEGLRVVVAKEETGRDPFLERVRARPLRVGRRITAAEVRRLRDEVWLQTRQDETSRS